jgi:NAD(P)-dependent dehydrogenase (short-subunit alcohol dehydrogenase family)
MATILIIGENPDSTRPEDHPAGVTAETIRAALHEARAALRAKGHEAAILWTTSADRVANELADAVRGHRYDVLVIGAGLRVLPPMAAQFERLMNAIREHAPTARLAFNSRPEDTAEAAERQLAVARV